MPIVTVEAPAKTNLVLRVGPRRPDGFHDLATVFLSLDLHDTLTLRAAPAGAGISVTVTGAQRHLIPTDESNLAVRALQLLAGRLGVAADVHLRLHKAIPVAGGMAGGSADAAAALVAGAALWTTPSIRPELAELAAELGSDVPFCRLGGAAVGTGRGELLTPLDVAPLHWVIVPGRGGLSTPVVFRELDALREGRADGSAPLPEAADVVSAELAEALRVGDAGVVGQHLRNDLQEPAARLDPGLRRALEAGEAAGAIAGIVSGSGPTCIFLCVDGAHARVVADRLGGVAAAGPVPGPVAVMHEGIQEG